MVRLLVYLLLSLTLITVATIVYIKKRKEEQTNKLLSMKRNLGKYKVLPSNGFEGFEGCNDKQNIEDEQIKKDEIDAEIAESKFKDWVLVGYITSYDDQFNRLNLYKKYSSQENKPTNNFYEKDSYSNYIFKLVKNGKDYPIESRLIYNQNPISEIKGLNGPFSIV